MSGVINILLALLLLLLVHHRYCRFLFKSYFQVIAKNSLRGLLAQDFLQVGCPSWHPTSGVKALKAALLIQLERHSVEHIHPPTRLLMS